MLKKWIFYSSIILIVTFISLAFKPFEPQNYNWFSSSDSGESVYGFPTLNQNDYVNLNIPYTAKFFIGFKEALAFKESQGKYHIVNTFGYMGKYQFSSETLKTVGIENDSKFLRSPKLQEKAFIALLSKNKWILRNEIQQFSGKIIDGVKITESGILAAAHLGGVGSVKKFLYTNGVRKCKDGYGTSIKTYMRDFGGYETDKIIANRTAKAM